MLQNTYSAFDKKAVFFLGTFTARSDSEASRMFGDGVQDRKSLLALHPEDYALYRLGTFDDTSGQISGEATPVFICEAMNFVSPIPSVEAP